MHYIGTNPFITSYLQSDPFGKGIFLSLFVLSAVTWALLGYKIFSHWKVRKASKAFEEAWKGAEREPLSFQAGKMSVASPSFALYCTFKTYALKLLERRPKLIEADLALLEAELSSTLLQEEQKVDQHLFLLATIQTLAPFLGLLGTVWGILITFANPQQIKNGEALSGLSMALTTTILGLVIAIPALIGYQVLKNSARTLKKEMEHFCQKLLTAAEFKLKRDEE